jgi:hypothetical protein
MTNVTSITRKDEARTVELLNEYGQAKFGDEWWPGSPWAYLGRERGDELCRLLGTETSDQVGAEGAP